MVFSEIPLMIDEMPPSHEFENLLICWCEACRRSIKFVEVPLERGALKVILGIKIETQRCSESLRRIIFEKVEIQLNTRTL
jgi:hypothetical protein